MPVIIIIRSAIYRRTTSVGHIHHVIFRMHLPSALPTREELRPAALSSSLTTGFLLYILEIVHVISFAALVFAGPYAYLLPQALAFIIAGNALLIAVIALFSSYRGTIGVAQDAPVAIIALAAAALTTTTAGAAVHFATVLMLIVFTSVMTGALFLLLGLFRLGGLARYLPYPVMGGFLAGTGWLLARGGLDVMAGVPPGAAWLAPPVLWHWLPGAVAGVVIYAVAARVDNPVVVPALLALGTVLFYGVAAALGATPADLEANGWLVGALPEGNLARFPLNLATVADTDWALLWQQLPNMLSAAVIGVIALLLNSTGLELVIRRDVDLNRELVAAGVGNLAAGVLGGLPGYHAISNTALNHKLGGGSRLTALIVAGLLVATLVFGTAVLRFIPTMVMGAVLVYVGVALLVEWVYDAWFQFARIDFAMIVAILGVIVFSSFLNGVLFGLVLAVILFVVSYSRVNLVKFALTGRDFRSRVTRPPSQRRLLADHGDELLVLKLRGFIFFGTANNILEQVRRAATGSTATPTRFVLIDFMQVSGLDSTGLLSFARLQQWCQERGITLVLTGLHGRAREQFARGGFGEQAGVLRFFDDIDHGVEWCEEAIIGRIHPPSPAQHTLAAELSAIANGADVSRLLAHMQLRRFAPGDYLIHQGDQPDTIFFIDSGQVTAQLEQPGQPPVRLETMGAGRTVGELGFYLGIPRTAAVIVDEPSAVYTLSQADLAHIEARDPEAANLLHRIVVHLLGERVVHLIRTVDALER